MNAMCTDTMLSTVRTRRKSKEKEREDNMRLLPKMSQTRRRRKMTSKTLPMVFEKSSSLFLPFQVLLQMTKTYGWWTVEHPDI